MKNSNSIVLILGKIFLISTLLYGLFMLCTYVTQAYFLKQLEPTLTAIFLITVIACYLALDFLFNLGVQIPGCYDDENDNLNPEDYEF